MPAIILWGSGSLWEFHIPTYLNAIQNAPGNGLVFNISCGHDSDTDNSQLYYYW